MYSLKNILCKAKKVEGEGGTYLWEAHPVAEDSSSPISSLRERKDAVRLTIPLHTYIHTHTAQAGTSKRCLRMGGDWRWGGHPSLKSMKG